MVAGQSGKLSSLLYIRKGKGTIITHKVGLNNPSKLRKEVRPESDSGLLSTAAANSPFCTAPAMPVPSWEGHTARWVMKTHLDAGFF